MEGGTLRDGEVVFPMHVGVNQIDAGIIEDLIRIPHACGGEPEDLDANRIQ